MGNYYKDNDDIRYYIEKGIDWAPLVDITERVKDDPERHEDVQSAVGFYQEILAMVGEFVAEEMAPHAAAIDRQGVELVDGEVKFPPELDRIFEKIDELELHGMCLPRELGGMNVPLLIYFLNTEIMGRADVSTMAHHSFHGGIAMAMLVFSAQEGTTEVDAASGRITRTRWQDYIGEIARGDAWGCMDITEPDAGSDMAKLRAVGEQDDDGNWYVTGEKIFITSGHGKYHFVIARTEKAGDPNDPMAGLKGLSMFLVPAYEEDAQGNRKRIVEIARVEEKMGHHGSATCSLVFDRAPAQLVGERGHGFKHMLLLMNNARLGVGFECIGLCEAAYRLARDYAAERQSMGKTIDRHEMIADYLDEMATDIQGLRALGVYGAWHEEMGQKIGLRLRFEEGLDDTERKRLERQQKHHQWQARRVTPLLKYYGAEKAVEHARRAVQIHGGNGYIKEYGAEKLLRDAVVMPIYEGTSQIQSLMAMKDSLGGVMKDPQGFVRRIAQARWRAVGARDPLERRVAKIQSTSLAVQQHLVARTAGDKFKSLRGVPITEWGDRFLKNWDPKRDFAFAMLHAERLTRILVDECVAELLLEQAKKHPERREVLERWLERAEPRTKLLAEEITATGERLLGRLARRQAAADAADAAAAE
ncbi:MAG: acyl-CoA dehydrogenase family protein [Myxococcota bacterium]